jgi:hypothetical protein
MPLRDHFRPPISQRASWEGFHGMWPARIVMQLQDTLPPGYIAEPRIHLGTMIEIDVGALETDDPPEFPHTHTEGREDAGALLWTGERPVVAVDTEPPEEYEYEVLIFDLNRHRRLVAAIELVSLANKDRPQSREAFVAKCSAFLRKGIAVSLVDLVTNRRFNLYAQLMESIGHPDPTMSPDEPSTYAAACRWITLGTRARLEAWSHALVLGKPLLTLPLWLSEDLRIPLDLEPSYQQACHDLRIA